MLDANVLLGDAYAILPTLPTDSAAAIITDPPYGLQSEPWDVAIPPQSFLDECLRVSAGPVLWFSGSPVECVSSIASLRPAPDRMLVWAPALSWSKRARHGMFFAFHPIWCWRLPVAQKAVSFDVFRHNTAGRQWWNHPHTKPVPLLVDLVRAFSQPGDTILDPFTGSGTTAVACIQTGRGFLGVEQNPEYHGIALRRIQEAQQDGPLFQAALFA